MENQVPSCQEARTDGLWMSLGCGSRAYMMRLQHLQRGMTRGPFLTPDCFDSYGAYIGYLSILHREDLLKSLASLMQPTSSILSKDFCSSLHLRADRDSMPGLSLGVPAVPGRIRRRFNWLLCPSSLSPAVLRISLGVLGAAKALLP